MPRVADFQRQLMELLSVDAFTAAGWGTAGAFAALTIPAMPFLSRWNRGGVGILLNVASTAAAALLAGMLPGRNGRRAQQVAAGGMIATLMRAGSEFLPRFPIAITAQPLTIPGLPGMGQANADVLADQIAEEAVRRIGVADYDTGLEAPDMGSMSDYDTGLEQYAEQGSPTLTY